MKKFDYLINSYSEGKTLSQEFYLADEIFDYEIKKIYFNQWLMVDHLSRIPKQGDYFLFNVEKESLIIIRGRDDVVRAFYNVCTHRGSRICLEEEGNKKLLVCPYHAWSFDSEGQLKAARFMSDDFNPKDWGLRLCHLRIYSGLIFVNFALGDPDNFEEFVEPLNPYLNLHKLEDAKVAYRKKYPVKANWKTTLENFQECYHCVPSHKSFSSIHDKEYVNIYGAGKGSAPDEETEAYEKKIEPWNQEQNKKGILTGHYLEEKTEIGLTRYADRIPIGNQNESQTEDGKFASTLMGNFKNLGPDYGITQISYNPFSNSYLTNDFVILFIFKPINTLETEVELIWLVDKGAIEGKDYDVNKMIWCWDVTTQEDTKIIEDNFKGIQSQSYKPGTLSEIEKAINYFYNWYFINLRKEKNGQTL